MHAMVPKPFSLVIAVTLSVAVAGFAAGGEIEVRAFSGQPFGVGQITVHFDSSPALPLDAPVWLVEKGGRALYPVMETTGIRVPTSKHGAGPASLAAYFLFRGDEPLTLTVKTDTGHTAKVDPQNDETARQQLLNAWWNRYTAAARSVAASKAYQPLVENYLVGTLGRRLGLDVARLPMAWSGRESVDQALAVMTGAESVRIAAQTDVLLKDAGTVEPADQPLPQPVQSPPVRLPKVEGVVAIEPIAKHVPVECFYIRCGSFANFSWLRSTVDQWGGKIRQIAAVRGLDYGIGGRMERQLALRETVLAKLLGDAVISDVAIIGSDTFLREGAAIGVLFEARSDAALRLHIAQQRKDALAAEPTAEETTVRIGDRDVSLLSTPDNAVRSFWAVDGKYHLVTTSRTLARRFLEAGEGRDSLGESEEFRWARSIMPLAEDHTVFVYLSDPFFRQLVSPRYRIEMTRRTRAAGEGDLVRMAQLAAAAEGEPATKIEDLVARGLLPAGFDKRPDGSRAIADGNRIYDSLRGGYGSFLPVPDVEIKAATRSETAAYQQFAQIYQRQWRRMDPTIVGIRRQTLDAGSRERLIFDVHITPYAREHYEWMASWLSAADKRRWATVPGDIASAEINLLGHKYTLGVRDFVPYFAIRDGAVHYSGPSDERMPLYAAGDRSARPGAPSTYFLNSQFWKAESTDPNGDVRVKNIILGDGWLRRLPDVDLVAPSRQLLDEVASHVKLVTAERAAKVRVRVGDLAETELAASIHAEGYVRARKVSAGNVYFLHTLMQQLHVSGDQAREVAEQLLHARLVCPLGGRYRLQSGFTDVERWQSTAWTKESLYQETSVPKGFRTPLLAWLAGLSVEMNIDSTTLSTHIELDVRP